MKQILLFLTCANNQEADKISDALLDKHLVVCVKKNNVSSSFLWKGKKDKAEEVLLIMDSKESLFTKIEEEIKKIHSYETPVLVSVAVNQFSLGIDQWVKEELLNIK